jgi:hypothetical protein
MHNFFTLAPGALVAAASLVDEEAAYLPALGALVAAASLVDEEAALVEETEAFAYIDFSAREQHIEETLLLVVAVVNLALTRCLTRRRRQRVRARRSPRGRSSRGEWSRVGGRVL